MLLRRRTDRPALTGWELLRSDCLPVALARQRRLLDSGVGGAWNVDLKSGQVTIGAHGSRVEVLGNSSEPDSSWMFGWRLAAVNGLDPALAAASVRARTAARRYDAVAFEHDVVPFSEADPSEMASVCSVLAGRAPLYRGPHESGALFFTLEDLADLEPLPTVAVSNVLSEALMLGLQHHERAARSLLTAEGFDVSTADHGLQAVRGSDQVSVTFDTKGRLARTDSTLG